MNAAGSTLLFSTYLGGSGDDFAADVESNSVGNIYLVGGTSSLDFPLLTPLQGVYAGGIDAFVVKMSEALGLSPASLNFGTHAVGTASVPRMATLTNSGSAALNISSIDLTGTNASEFGLTHNCPASLAAGANCSLDATFSPTNAGMKSAAISIASDASGSPHMVALSGTVFVPAPAVFMNPVSLSFGSQLTGTTSAAQMVTLTNSGTAALDISGIALTGTDPAEFDLTHNCPASLAAAASCVLTGTFAPTSAGAKSATISITSNAPGSPHSVPLSGTGVTPPAVMLSIASLAFPGQLINTTSTTQSVTLTNTGGSTLSITSLNITGPHAGDFQRTDNCGSSVAAGANCTAMITARPTAAGTRTATLSFTTNAAGSPHNVALSATGTDFSIAPASVASTTATITAGATANYMLSIPPSNGFTATVTLTCSGAPQAATCTVPPSVNVDGMNAAAFTASVATTVRSLLPPPAAPWAMRWRTFPAPWLLVALLSVMLLLALIYLTQ